MLYVISSIKVREAFILANMYNPLLEARPLFLSYYELVTFFRKNCRSHFYRRRFKRLSAHLCIRKNVCDWPTRRRMEWVLKVKQIQIERSPQLLSIVSLHLVLFLSAQEKSNRLLGARMGNEHAMRRP